MRNLKQNWLTLMVSLIVTALFSYAVARATVRAEKLDGKADITYVDKENDDQDEKCLILKDDIQVQLDNQADKNVVKMIYDSQIRSEDRISKLVIRLEEKIDNIEK